MPSGDADLNGKVAIVTGATKGMGRAIAERFAEAGARVVVSSRTEADVAALLDELNTRFGGAAPVAVGCACQIERKSDLERVVDLALASFGTITTLVCNASGLAWLGPSNEMPDDQLDFQFLTVFKSKLWLVNLCLPAMFAAGGGSIIFIGSGSAAETTTERNVYACMRAAELHYMRNLAAEFGPQGVRANAVSPGLIDTFSSAPLFADAAARESFANSVPLRRTGTVDDIAAAALFLASDSSSFTTGLVLPVDGGRLIRAREKVLSRVHGGSHRASQMPSGQP